VNTIAAMMQTMSLKESKSHFRVEQAARNDQTSAKAKGARPSVSEKTYTRPQELAVMLSKLAKHNERLS
jgi:hypothetical protein